MWRERNVAGLEPNYCLSWAFFGSQIAITCMCPNTLTLTGKVGPNFLKDKTLFGMHKLNKNPSFPPTKGLRVLADST